MTCKSFVFAFFFFLEFHTLVTRSECGVLVSTCNTYVVSLHFGLRLRGGGNMGSIQDMVMQSVSGTTLVHLGKV